MKSTRRARKFVCSTCGRLQVVGQMIHSPSLGWTCRWHHRVAPNGASLLVVDGRLYGDPSRIVGQGALPRTGDVPYFVERSEDEGEVW